MQFTNMGDERIRVTLAADDLNDYQLIYHDFEKNSPKCRKVVLQLMGKAGRALGVDYNPSPASVEVFPAKDGGCVLYFSAKGQEKPSRKQEVWLSAPHLEPLCQAAAALCHLGLEQVTGSLWKLEGDFLLRLPLPKEDIKNFTSLLGEFGRVHDPWQQTLPFLQEHGQLLLQQDALKQLTRLI